MAFLVPAVISGVSDVLILVLQRHRQETLVQVHQVNVSNNISSSANNNEAVHHVQYLVIMAVLRLLLLVFPLPYHSYTGTAIPFPFCYHVFYALTVTAILLHMVSLSVMDPESLATLLHVPTPPPPTTNTNTNTSTSTTSESTDQYMWLIQSWSTQEMLIRSCWSILFLSLISVTGHIVMLIHVRSTAPSISYYSFSNKDRNKKKKLVYYYNHLVASQQQTANARHRSGLKQDDEDDHDDHNDLEQRPLAQHAKPFLQADGNQPQDHVTTLSKEKSNSPYEEFITEMQMQIAHFKKDWTHKLEDFTQRHLTLITNNTTLGISLPLPQHPLQHNNPLLPLTPFRVLLQLFAYDDVIDSGKLDAVFDTDSGQSLTFFVPQLLSFLLHGAYYEADPTKLEAWILEKCRTNVHFAHRCYWFLRAWSLEQQQTSTFCTPAHSMTSLHHHAGNCSIVGLGHISSADQPCATLAAEQQQQQQHSRNNSFASLTAGPSSILLSSKGCNHHHRLLPEERAVVEDLMFRVVQSGQSAARILQYGRPQTAAPSNGDHRDARKGKLRRERDKSTLSGQQQQQHTTVKQKSSPDSLSTPPGTPISISSNAGLFWDDDEGHDQDSWEELCQHLPFGASSLVPELVMTPEMEASLPVDPNTGFPSHRHLKVLTTKQRFGFVSLATAKKEQMNSPAATPSVSTTDFFHATPRFLDALVAIADGLSLVPKENRRKILQRQLENLEVELLPSNSAYGKYIIFNVRKASKVFGSMCIYYCQNHSADFKRVP